jgi:hypothetical protein
MPAPDFVNELFAWRALDSRTVKRLKRPYAPNNADADNLLIAEQVFLDMNVRDVIPRGTTMGSGFESRIRSDLEGSLPRIDPSRQWSVVNSRNVADFEQYKHLSTLDAAMRSSVTLRMEFGRDYRIVPDVVVGVERPGQDPLLHAVVSCKWSMRSDRVQNVRPEGATLMRHRRGRAPHFVVVTAEPLPTRIASIAMTTGEIDRVYHVAFEEMQAAVSVAGSIAQRDSWEEMVSQGRLRDYKTLAETFSLI